MMMNGAVKLLLLLALVFSGIDAQAQTPDNAAKEEVEWGMPPRDGPVASDIPPAPLDLRGLDNLAAFARLYGLVRWFHPTDTAAQADWNAIAIGAIAPVERATDAAQLASVLNHIFHPLAPELEIVVGTRPALRGHAPLSGQVLRWKHVGLGETSDSYTSERVTMAAAGGSRPAIAGELPSGLAFSLPLTVGLADRAGGGRQIIGHGRPPDWIPAGFDRSTRLAAVVAGWSVLDHFYPYWDEVQVDWEAELRDRLQDAAIAPNDIAMRQVLSRLVEPLDDGHSWAGYGNPFVSSLPLAWRLVEDRLVIIATSEGADGVEPGMVVEEVDGVPARQFLDRKMALISGSPQHRRQMATAYGRFFAEEGASTLTVSDADGRRNTVTVKRVSPRDTFALSEQRPEPIDDIGNGILYADVTRWSNEVFTENVGRLSKARGIIFDLRGYPRGSKDWLGHLVADPIRSPMFLDPTFITPDGEAQYPEDGGWTIKPAAPYIGAELVFLTDARAISYAESVLGTVRENDLGPIVGGTTAGANGDMAIFDLPGHYRIAYTGVMVRNRDGSPHHVRGIVPDIEVEPTIAGIRAGRDEVLDAGIEILRGRLDGADRPTMLHGAH